MSVPYTSARVNRGSAKKNPESFLSRGISTQFRTENSDASIDDDSVFSAPIPPPSTMTLGSGNGDVDALLIQDFATLLYRDGILTSLISTAVSKQSIGVRRIQYKFRKLLKHYARDLKAETSNDSHRNFVAFVTCHSAAITQEMFSKISINEQGAAARIPEFIRDPRDTEERRKKVEEYLRKTPDHTSSAESAEFGGPKNRSKFNDVDGQNGNSDSDEDSDPFSVSEDDGEGELYDGSLQHLDRQLTRLTLKSVAYQTLLRRLHEFTHPTLQSKLRDLVAVWSKPDNGYNAYLTRYRLSDLVAELQYILPQEIRFDHGKEDDHHTRGLISYCQNIVECWTGEQWDWWPFIPFSRPLGQWETRVRWECVSSLLFGLSRIFIALVC